MHLWVCLISFVLAIIYFFMLFIFYMFLVFDTIFLVYTGRASLRLDGMSLLVWRGVAHEGAGPSGTVGEYDIDLDEVEES